MAGKTKRLNKVANEFNVGVATIAEFLQSKGVEIDASPNAKVLPEMYNLVLDKFGSDKAKKVESQELRNKKVERKTISLEKEVVTPKPEVIPTPPPVVKEEPPVAPPVVEKEVEAEVQNAE